MTLYVREDAYALVAHSHLWNNGFRDIELKGKELRTTMIHSIEEGMMELDYQGHIVRVPVEKLLFDRRDLINSERY